jgi:hypothetical protein
MNVSINPYHPSRAIARIDVNLRAHLPSGMTWTEPDDADLLVFPVFGRHDHVAIWADYIKKEGRKYALIQLSLKSTRNPDPADWLELWQGAVCVWSYYYLPGKFNFYHAPLGADPAIFHPLNINRSYVVGTTGNYPRTECLFEVEKAAREAGQRMLKIHSVSNEELNHQYNQCYYMSGLRHKEGFELPAAEGMLAGARPILFDTPDFRQWYDGIAEFIPEDNILATINNLTRLFKSSPLQVSPKEIMLARWRFDWGRVVTGFWERCL